MGTVTTIAAGRWHADAATVWDTGAEPGPLDDAVVNHALTKDDDKGDGNWDCKTLTVGAAGVQKDITWSEGASLRVNGDGNVNSLMTINGGSFILAGTLTGPGFYTVMLILTAGGVITAANITGTLRVLLRATGTQENPCIITCNGASGTARIQHLATWEQVWTKFIGVGKAMNLIINRSLPYKFENCDFSGWYTTQCEVGTIIYRDCYFYDNAYGIFTGSSQGCWLEGCVFGRDRTGASSPNTSVDCDTYYGPVRAYGCTFASTVKYGLNGSVLHNCDGLGEFTTGSILFRQNTANCGLVRRSTAAKKAGDYGMEFVCAASTGVGNPIILEYMIPVKSGQIVTPEFEYKNVTADLDLEAAASRFIAELDPGNEWGRRESWDANGGSDSYNNWIKKTFTGGVVGGTGAEGMMILRITLQRTATNAKVYVADMAY